MIDLLCSPRVTEFLPTPNHSESHRTLTSMNTPSMPKGEFTHLMRIKQAILYREFPAFSNGDYSTPAKLQPAKSAWPHSFSSPPYEQPRLALSVGDRKILFERVLALREHPRPYEF